MFERFSRDARVAVVLAQEEARVLQHLSIGPEHLLLGTLKSAEGPVQRVLEDSGFVLAEVRAEVVRLHSGDGLGDADAEALRSIGIDLDAVRASLEASFGKDVLAERAEDRSRWFGRKWSSGHIPFARQSKKALELALREALARKDDHIGCEHLVLGILRDPEGIVKTVIEAKVPVATLRRDVLSALDKAA